MSIVLPDPAAVAAAPAPEKLTPGPARVVVRSDDLDDAHDEIAEALIALGRSWWLSPDERETAALELLELGINAAAQALTQEAIDGASAIVKRIGKRDPYKIRRRAERARRNGKPERGARLEKEADEIEARAYGTPGEARRGNAP